MKANVAVRMFCGLLLSEVHNRQDCTRIQHWKKSSCFFAHLPKIRLRPKYVAWFPDSATFRKQWVSVWHSLFIYWFYHV